MNRRFLPRRHGSTPPQPAAAEAHTLKPGPTPGSDDGNPISDRHTDTDIDRTPLLPPVPFVPGTYRVTYDRVGLHGSAHSKEPAPPPLIADAETGDDLVTKIIADSLRYLGSRTVDVVVDLHLMAGQILTGIGHVGGTFTVEILASKHAERVTVFLTTASTTALGKAAALTGDTRTDVINRAIQAYAMQASAVAAGDRVLIQHGASGKDTSDAVQAPVGESTQAAPDLLSIVTDALSDGQGPLLPLPAQTRRLLAARVTDAITPFVAYRPVWDSSLPPGGLVCSICGQPVESEPCAEHGLSGNAAVPEGGA